MADEVLYGTHYGHHPTFQYGAMTVQNVLWQFEQAVETTVARLSVADYSLNLGTFVTSPLLRLRMSVMEIVDSGGIEFSDVREPDALYLPLGSATRWHPEWGGPVLDGTPESVLETIPDAVTDRTCRRTRPALLMAPGGSYSGLLRQSRSAWFVMVCRPMRTADASDARLGMLRGVYADVAVAMNGSGLWVVPGGTSAGVSFRFAKPEAKDTSPLVVGLAFDSGQLVAAMMDSGGLSVESTASSVDDYATEVEFGGGTSPKMLLYAAALGDGGAERMLSVVKRFREVVTC